MNKVSRLIVAALSVGLVFGATSTTSAQAASKVKVVSTKKVKKVAYHATKGKLYSTSKLKKVKYQIKKYPHTTWYSFKKATVKKNGKKASYTYVKAGKKSGWLYSKYLIKGKAPKVKKAVKPTPTPAPTPAKQTKPVASAQLSQKQQFRNLATSIARVVQNGSALAQTYVSFAGDTSYSDLAEDVDIFSTHAFDWNLNSGDDFDNIENLGRNRTVLVQIYQLLRGHFSASQNADFDQMSSKVANVSVNDANFDEVAAQSHTFGESLKTALDQLD